MDELTRDRSSLNMAGANREVYQLLKEGAPVVFRDAEDVDNFERVRVIEWNTPEKYV